MSNKRGSSCSTPGARTPAPAPRRLFRRSPGDVPCPPLGAGTRKPLPVSPPFMPFTVRSHDGSECRSRLGRVGPRPAHRPSRRAGSPSSPAPLAGGSPSISPSVPAGLGSGPPGARVLADLSKGTDHRAQMQRQRRQAELGGGPPPAVPGSAPRSARPQAAAAGRS